MRWNKNPIPLCAVVGGAGKTCASHLIRNVLEAGRRKHYGLITTRHAYVGGQCAAAACLARMAAKNWTGSWKKCGRRTAMRLY